MIKTLLGSKKKENNKEKEKNAALMAKISHMNLSEMRTYVKNKMAEFEVNEDGLNEIMRRLTQQNKKSKQYYLKPDDMDSKKKKAFDLVLAIAQNKKINLQTVESIRIFTEIYKDIIIAYDKEHMEIYASRFIDALNGALAIINQKVALKNKMDILGENK